MSDLQGFERALDAAGAQMEGRALAYPQHLARRFLQEVAVGGSYSPGTPVRSGKAQRAWYVQLLRAGEKSERVPLASVDQALTDYQLGDSILIGNRRAYYVRRLEYGFVGRDKMGRRYNVPGRAFFRLAMNALDALGDEAFAFARAIP